MDDDERASLLELIHEANRAWVGQRPTEVSRLFHPDVVMASPRGGAMMRGRDEVVASFVAYCERAVTHDFRELDHEVHVFGDTAVVSYAFSIAYELGTERHDERGREVLVFNRREGSWKVVWRMQIPGTAESRPA